MDDFLRKLAPANDPLLYDDDDDDDDQSSLLPSTVQLDSLRNVEIDGLWLTVAKNSPYGRNEPSCSYTPWFAGSAGSAFGNGSYLNEPRGGQSQTFGGTQGDPEYLASSNAKHVEQDSGCSSQGCWSPRVHSRPEVNGKQELSAPQQRSKAAKHRSLSIISESTAKPQSDLSSPSHEFRDLSSQRSSFQEPLLIRTSRKRSSTDSTSDDLTPTSPSTKLKITGDPRTKPGRQPKTSHCQVERKYRENLNAKFEILYQTIPSMQPSQSGKPASKSSEMEDAVNMVKPRKADILSSATDYVKQLEESNRRMGSEIDFLRSRVKAIEKLINCEDCYLLKGIQSISVELPGPDCLEERWMG